MSNAEAKRRFRERVRKAMEEADASFRGDYAQAITELHGLSREQIDEITPDDSDLATYDKLIAVVKAASAENVAQAELRNKIRDLGELAISIARKVPTLAALV